MANFKVEGPELKKLLKIAKKQPMAFGFNPGAKEEEHYFGLDRKKPSKVVGKEAKDEGPGAKFAFGMMRVIDKEIHLSCERELPGMAKKLKKWLNKQKVALNVVILDASGTVLEQDIEENLPDDPDLIEDGDTDAFSDQPDPVAAHDVKDEAQLAADALTQRLKEISARLKEVPAERAAQIVAALKAVVARAQSGDTAGASAGADKIEAALAQMAASVEPQHENSASKSDNPQVAKILTAVETLRGQAAALQDEAHQSQIVDLLQGAATKAQGGVIDAALGLLKRAQIVLKDALTSENNLDPNAAKWAAQFPKLEQAVQEAKALDGRINPDHPDLLKLAQLWQWARSNANEDPPNFAKALEVVPALVAQIKVLRAAKAAGDPALNAASDVKPFAEAQLKWRSARGKMMSELDKLKAAIVKVCADDPELAGVADEVGSLSVYLIGLDDRLEDAMIDVINAPQGRARDTAKTAAKQVLPSPALLQSHMTAGRCGAAERLRADDGLCDMCYSKLP